MQVQKAQGAGAHAMTALSKWLYDNFNDAKGRGDNTHVSMAGGRYHLPPHAEPELQERLAEAFDLCDADDAALLEQVDQRLVHLGQLAEAKTTGAVVSMLDEDADQCIADDRAAVVAGRGTMQAIEHQKREVCNELKHELDEQTNSTAFLVEKRTEYFRYCVDFDLKERTPNLPVEQVLGYFHVLQDVLEMFYARRYELVLCNVVHSKQLEPRQWKHGYHVFADIFVDEQQALTVREMLVSELHQRYGPREDGCNDWTDVVDVSIYGGSGMRMLYCSKATHCKCKQTQECVQCRGAGKVFERWRRYRPWKVLRGDGTEDGDRLIQFQDKAYTLKALSLRHFGEPTPGYAPPPQAPLVFPAIKRMGKRAKHDGDLQEERSADEYANDRQCTQTLKNREPYKLEAAMRSQLETQLRRFNPYHYSHVNLHAIFRVNNPKNAYYIVHVRGKGSQFCLNVQREHNGNTIWFYINSLGLYQKCFCRCPKEEDRFFGLCRKFASGPRPLPPSLMQALFSKGKKPSEVDDPLALFRKNPWAPKE